MTGGNMKPAPDSAERPDKRIATARARAALAGATLHVAEDDRGDLVFIVSKWSLTRQLPDIEAVEAWLSRMPGSTASVDRST